MNVNDLKEAVRHINNVYDLLSDEYKQTMDISIVALKRQMPKPPVIVEELEIDGLTEMLCPTCGHFLHYADGEKDASFCAACGQAIGFEEK